MLTELQCLVEGQHTLDYEQQPRNFNNNLFMGMEYICESGLPFDIKRAVGVFQCESKNK